MFAGTKALVISVAVAVSGTSRAAEPEYRPAPDGADSKLGHVKAMLSYDAQHTGYVRRPGPRTEPGVLFQAPTGFEKAVFDMAPAIDAAGNLVSDIGSSWRAAEVGRTGGAIAFDSQGKELWRRIYPNLQYGLSVPALTGAGQAIMGFRDGWVRAFQLRDGSLLWDFHVGAGAVISAPVVDARGDVYFSSLGQGGVYKLDGRRGALRWNCPFPSGSGASPALSHDEETVYAGWAEVEAGLYAFDAATGEKRWKWAPDGAFFFDWCSPVVGHDGTIYQQNEENGMLFALEDTGTEARLKWSYTPAGTLNDAPRTPATDGKYVYLGASGVNPSFTALTLSGEVHWQYELKGKVEMAGIVVNDDAVYFPVVVPDGGAGWVYALDKKNGRELWRKKVTHDDSDVGGVTLGLSGILYAGTSGTVEHPYEGVLVALK